MIVRATESATVPHPTEEGAEYHLREGVAYNDNDPDIRALMKRWPMYFDKGSK